MNSKVHVPTPRGSVILHNVDELSDEQLAFDASEIFDFKESDMEEMSSTMN
jgi:hypothetical protein